MLNPKNLKIELIKEPMDTDAFARNEFVKILHIPSGICVTKHNSKSKIKARDEALEELEVLVRIYNGEDW